MKKNLIITSLLLMLIVNLIPITSKASNVTNSSLNTSLVTSSSDSIISVNSLDSSISYNLDPGVAKTRSVSGTKGETIYISAVISSSTSTGRIGIMDTDNTLHYASITGSGYISYKFPSTGTYKIYCKNTSSQAYAIALTFITE
ncbi:MAG: hypothetical protein ACERKZ_17530 [Lachnotalea sp.]